MSSLVGCFLGVVGHYKAAPVCFWWSSQEHQQSFFVDLTFDFMTQRSQERQAAQIRTNIKTAVAQLDSWILTQANLRRQQIEAVASSGGHQQRRLQARSIAVSSQGTQFVEDPP
jgi:ABC-type phosphate transport system ATPase subunit